MNARVGWAGPNFVPYETRHHRNIQVEADNRILCVESGTGTAREKRFEHRRTCMTQGSGKRHQLEIRVERPEHFEVLRPTDDGVIRYRTGARPPLLGDLTDDPRRICDMQLSTLVGEPAREHGKTVSNLAEQDRLRPVHVGQTQRGHGHAGPGGDVMDSILGLEFGSPIPDLRRCWSLSVDGSSLVSVNEEAAGKHEVLHTGGHGGPGQLQGPIDDRRFESTEGLETSPPAEVDDRIDVLNGSLQSGWNSEVSLNGLYVIGVEK